MAEAYIFHYNHLLPRKPPLAPSQPEKEHTCCDCGASFVTRANRAKRCPKCRPAAQQRAQERSDKRKRDERRKLRELRLR